MDLEKTSAYECGFTPFAESRHQFSVKFYLVSLIFLIFDLEIIYLFPFAKNLPYLGINAFIINIFFILILGLGVFYEIRKKAIEF
jgi:NADH-quinone oxidoreductase subunit A